MENKFIFEKKLVKNIYLLLSLSYAYFIYSFSLLEHDAYLNYMSNSDVILKRHLETGSYKSVFFNEPLWLYLNIVLSKFLVAKSQLGLIAFISSFIFCYVLLSNIDNKNKVLFIVMLLFLPLVLRYRLTGFRQGLAISIFLYAWFLNNKKNKLIIYFILPFIHSSFFISLYLIFVITYLNKIKISIYLKMFLFFILSLLVTFSLLYISTTLGARQGDSYQEVGVSNSGLGFIYWTFVFYLFFREGKTFIKNNFIVFNILIFYLSSYWFLIFSGRIFESFLVLVVFVGLRLTGNRLLLFKSSFLLYFSAAWAVKLVSA